MTKSPTTLIGPRLPAKVVDWVIDTLVNDYGWSPYYGREFDKEFGLGAIVKELLIEASLRPEFSQYSLVCNVRAMAPNPSRIVHMRLYRGSRSKEHFERVAANVYKRHTEPGGFMTYVVNIERKRGGRNIKIKRHIPGGLEAAISYRDRLLQVLDGPNPEEYLKVPLLTHSF